MLQYALKEWAVICRALELGKQSILLRKGGIAEDFRLEHHRFWLFPTYVHQQRDGISPEGALWLDEAMNDRPPTSVIRISHWAEVTGVWHLRELATALSLSHLHYWSEDTVRKRFEYRTPGLHAWAVRVYRAPSPMNIEDTIGYQGCRSWVTLDQSLPTSGSIPVLEDTADFKASQTLKLLLASGTRRSDRSDIAL
ncbi:MAG: DUF1802 family protein [Gemmataceae bacterium]